MHMNILDSDYIQTIVKINGKYYMILLDTATKKIVLDLIAKIGSGIKLLETELPSEEISMDELRRISKMSK